MLHEYWPHQWVNRRRAVVAEPTYALSVDLDSNPSFIGNGFSQRLRDGLTVSLDIWGIDQVHTHPCRVSFLKTRDYSQQRHDTVESTP